MQSIFLLDLLLAVFFLDMMTGKIPNWITAGGALCGLINAAAEQIMPFGIYSMLRIGYEDASGMLSAVIPEGIRTAHIPIDSPIIWSLAGGLLILLILWPVYRCHGLAAGDVKLLAMCGFWCGPLGGIGISAYSLVFGGTMGLCLLVAACLSGDREDRGQEIFREGTMMVPKIRREFSIHRIHFAPAVLAGCVLILGGE